MQRAKDAASGIGESLPDREAGADGTTGKAPVESIAESGAPLHSSIRKSRINSRFSFNVCLEKPNIHSSIAGDLAPFSLVDHSKLTSIPILVSLTHAF